PGRTIPAPERTIFAVEKTISADAKTVSASGKMIFAPGKRILPSAKTAKTHGTWGKSEQDPGKPGVLRPPTEVFLPLADGTSPTAGEAEFAQEGKTLPAEEVRPRFQHRIGKAG